MAHQMLRPRSRIRFGTNRNQSRPTVLLAWRTKPAWGPGRMRSSTALPRSQDRTVMATSVPVVGWRSASQTIHGVVRSLTGSLMYHWLALYLRYCDLVLTMGPVMVVVGERRSTTRLWAR